MEDFIERKRKRKRRYIWCEKAQYGDGDGDGDGERGEGEQRIAAFNAIRYEARMRRIFGQFCRYREVGWKKHLKIRKIRVDM